MKKYLITAMICLFASLQTFGQSNDSIKSFEIGAGVGGCPSGSGIVNVGGSITINKYLAVFADYNMFFGRFDILAHELNFKVGPYAKFGKSSFAAISSGLSVMFNPMASNSGNNFNSIGDGTPVLNIPIQFKLKFGIYKWIGCGVKLTYNKVLPASTDDRNSAIFFISFGQ